MMASILAAYSTANMIIALKQAFYQSALDEKSTTYFTLIYNKLLKGK